MTAAIVALALAAIVAANVIVAQFGPTASIYNAFAFIGLALVARDKLDDASRKHRLRNVSLFILAGAVLSYVAARIFVDAPPEIVARIALASGVTFAVAETLDWIRYAQLRARPFIERSVGSNFVGAAADSVLFVTIAFGFSFEIAFLQFCAKVAGGALYAHLLQPKMERRAAEAAA
jgi:hypothetical protein